MYKRQDITRIIANAGNGLTGDADITSGDATFTFEVGAGTGITVNSNDVAGPIGIAKISGDALVGGLSSFVFLMAILSINLGLINLLPIPALDGGYITLYIMEFIFGKP